MQWITAANSVSIVILVIALTLTCISLADALREIRAIQDRVSAEQRKAEPESEQP